VFRESLKNASRIVVKFGTGVLTDSRKQPDLAQMKQLAGQVAAIRAQGKQVVIVTSGAVGAGMGLLGYEKRPAELSELQACAAVGQSRSWRLTKNCSARPVSRRPSIADPRRS
jgi:glutamate 5-kinase